MKERYLNAYYGHCPRALCENQAVLPACLCELLRFARVKVYCPRCEEVYINEKGIIEVDGAYYGKTFPTVFFQTYPQLIPKEKYTPYIPKIFGFKIYKKKGSKYEKKRKYKYKDSLI